ncbi:MAG: TIM44-like domain-containing protein [Candidatus Rokubacteria bacterium]|nr:TIM44-like domain-containing protein [Candidatus Rokubacteria bacterium]
MVLDGMTRRLGTRGARPAADVNFEGGLKDVRATDPGFDPSRFTGYAAMTFRDTQQAWMARNLAPLRDRFTPELAAALEAHAARLRERRLANRVEDVEIVARVTDAWQEDGRDYVTAHVTGATIDYTVDERGQVVEGSKTSPRPVDELWTFTRPPGLNPWMLSAIQS